MTKPEQSLSAIQNAQRRTLVLSGLASAVLAGFAPAGQAGTAAQRITLDEFLGMSAWLTHRPASSLNRDMAQRILDALLAQGQQEELAQLARNPSVNAALAARVRAAWFSGVLPGHQPTLLGYEHALVWSAAAFLHTPGTCGGPTGYWAQPPVSNA